MANKTKYVGLLLIFVMFFSSIAFGVLNSIASQPESQPTPSGKEVQIERHTKRLLTEQEKAGLLQQGATILEFLQGKDCLKCADYRPLIEGFSTKFNDIVLVDAESTATLIQFTGKTTKQVENVTEKSLLDAYCEASILQPKECILKNI